MLKVDPHNSEYYLERWKDRNLNLSKSNSEIIREYISDMEIGRNTSGSKKGGRSKIKLLAIARQVERMLFLLEVEFKVKDVKKLSEKTLIEFFNQLTQGKILNTYGKPYKSVGDYAARFKAFWHWYMKSRKKKNIIIPDICEDLSTNKKEKPPFVYFTNKELEKMIDKADYETRVFISFLFDTGIRSPTEALNIRVFDFRDDYSQLNIREEITKTFGRQIRLMMCGDAIKKYVDDNNLQGSDLLFTFTPPAMNKRLKKLGMLVLGNEATIGRKKGSELTMYDFRHSSGCFWLPRYKSESALKYRFGWKKSDMIFYYTELLGMKDTINDEDMLINITKTEIEKKLIGQDKQLKKMQKTIESLSTQVLKLEGGVLNDEGLVVGFDKEIDSFWQQKMKNK